MFMIVSEHSEAAVKELKLDPDASLPQVAATVSVVQL